MIPVAFTYERAASVDDAVKKLGAGDAKLIAGGHSPGTADETAFE